MAEYFKNIPRGYVFFKHDSKLFVSAWSLLCQPCPFVSTLSFRLEPLSFGNLVSLWSLSSQLCPFVSNLSLCLKIFSFSFQRCYLVFIWTICFLFRFNPIFSLQRNGPSLPSWTSWPDNLNQLSKLVQLVQLTHLNQWIIRVNWVTWANKN